MKEYKKPTWVRAGKHGWVNINAVKVEDVSSDVWGADVYTFSYQDENGMELIYQSSAVQGSQPG